ncbi:hypothetical protein [Aliirhizobium smilacinae]|uniref:Uncharacterized protein n=1 Tax=Aliirhizobium smilacinae TaxID=1395944 RepID=A0A5C4XRX3_9HYPH|nr:hypothetical protein [Rhizobium smilacinae]TNM65300.1 hypothetical protein FHP24_03200 [Rhizobium smilacinae]
MPTLKELSIAIGLLTSDQNPVANADGWTDYVWRVRESDKCLSVADGFCTLVKDSWDWKRPQYYEFAFKADEASNTIMSRITLRNEDIADDDQVCVVASFLDASGIERGVLFVNWRSLHGRTYSRSAPIQLATPTRDIVTVAVGTKQCQLKALADSQNFYRKRAELKQR